MAKNSTEERMVRNEQKLRDKNIHAKDAIKKYFKKSAETIAAESLPFVCECSDMNCEHKVKISISEFEKIHKRNDRFAIAKGHETLAVENIVKEKANFDIVEKDNLAP